MLLPLTTRGHGQSIGGAARADRISDRRLQAQGPMEGFACQGTTYDSPSRIRKSHCPAGDLAPMSAIGPSRHDVLQRTCLLLTQSGYYE